MKTLETQLAEYCEYQSKLHGPISADEITTEREVVVLDLLDRSSDDGDIAHAERRSWLPYVLAAAAAGLLAISGLSLLYSGDEGSTDVISDPDIDRETPEPSVPDSVEFEVTWTEAQWAADEGPYGYAVVDMSSVLIGGGPAAGIGQGDTLWRSSDGETWERMFADMTHVDFTGDESSALVAGRRSDRSTALLQSVDGGVNWTEVDHSVLETDDSLTVVSTTPSGLTWLRRVLPSEDGGDVLAVIDGDRLVDAHTPPWDIEHCCVSTHIVELPSGIVASQSDFNEPRFNRAWRYLGDGNWSDSVDIPLGSNHAKVNDTVLMFDRTNATCCDDPYPMTEWPLLASNDGTTWTEIYRLPGENVHALHLGAGASFWIYQTFIIVGNDTPVDSIWISHDGRNWTTIDAPLLEDTMPFTGPRVDTFVRVSGETIFVSDLSDDHLVTLRMGRVTQRPPAS